MAMTDGELRGGLLFKNRELKSNRMKSYPTIRDLSELLFANDWEWERPAKDLCDRRLGMCKDWWIGISPDGRKWLVKMRGSARAYREHAFASLAQLIVISCQSSAFLKIPDNAPPLLEASGVEPFQLALCFLDEHDNDCPDPGCPFKKLRDVDFGSKLGLAGYLNSGIAFAEDYVRGEALGFLCGQFEPPGRLFTKTHELVQIDNEAMFNSGPVDLMKKCDWWRLNEGRRLCLEVCERISFLPDEKLLAVADFPREYKVARNSSIKRKLLAAKRSASKILRFGHFEKAEQMPKLL